MGHDYHAIARTFIESIPSGKLRTDLIGDGFTAWSTGSGEMPGDRLAGGVAVLATVFASPLQIEIGAITVEGDRAIVEARSHGPLVDGNTYSNTYVFVLHVADGKILRFEEHNNPVEVREKLGPLMKAAIEKMKA